MRSINLYLIILSCAAVSCVSTGKYKAAQKETDKYDSLYTWSMRTLKTSQDNNKDLTRQKTTMQDQVREMDLELTASKENNILLRKQLLSLSALSSAQAESIKKSLDNIGAKDMYLMDLRAALSHRDSVNMIVVLNLKAAIGGFGDQDVSIKLENGVVHVDLSDKLLFNSDSAGSTGYTVTNKAKAVLGRLARVLNALPDIEFMVEGHTDGAVVKKDKPARQLDSAAIQAVTASLRVTDSAVAIQTDSASVHPDSGVALIDTAKIHADKVALQVDSAILHTDSAVALTDTATIHADKVALQVDHVTLHADSALALQVDSVSAHPDSAVVRIDSAATHTDSAVVRLDSSITPRIDSVPVQRVLVDNWDISVKRATALVRILQNDYHVSPVRMTAAGRSEYILVAPNDTPEGRDANRRTRIIIIPQLDQVLRLLEQKQGRTATPAPVIVSGVTVSGS
jgi:chemotaxis protein MotB